MEEQDKFNDALKDMVGDINDASGATNELVKVLLSLNKASKEELLAKEAEGRVLEKLRERAQSVSSGLAGLATGTISLLAGLNSVTSGVYGADKAFTAVVPTLDLFADTTKKIITAFGDLGSGVSILGFSTGKISEGAAKIAGVGVDILTNIAKFQLETAQKVADSFVEATKSGATFGGSINRMAMAASDAGLPLMQFSKLITSNAAGLSSMGMGIQQAAVVVGQMGNNIAKGNPRLLATYGSYDNLNNAIADYATLQAQVGAGELKDRKALEQGAMKYLDQQKELTALTGRSAEQLKKEQEERQKDAAYQLAMNKMTADERLNSEYALSQISAKYGAEAAQYAKEFISTGGKVFSQSGLAFEAMMGPVAQTVQGVVGNLKESNEAFKGNTNNIITQNAQRNLAFAKEQELFAQMTQAGYGGEITKALGSVAGSILAGQAQAEGAQDANLKIQKEKAEGIGAASQSFINATNTLLEQQKQIDGIVLKNMNSMSGLVEFLYKQQSDILKTQDIVNEAIQGMIDGDFKKFSGALGKLTDVILEKMGLLREDTNPTSAPVGAKGAEVGNVSDEASSIMDAQQEGQASRIAAEKALRDQQTGSATNKRAEGGVAYGPTLTGESGPEAHIPLKNGNIPMNIDFSSVIQVMREQNILTQELISQVRDSKDVQERILNASY